MKWNKIASLSCTSYCLLLCFASLLSSYYLTCYIHHLDKNLAYHKQPKIVERMDGWILGLSFAAFLMLSSSLPVSSCIVLANILQYLLKYLYLKKDLWEGFFFFFFENLYVFILYSHTINGLFARKQNPSRKSFSPKSPEVITPLPSTYQSFWEVLWQPDSWSLYDLFLLFEHFGYFLYICGALQFLDNKP